jgi:hypothetical protein
VPSKNVKITYRLTRPLAVREEFRLKVLEIRWLSRITGKRDEVRRE